MNSHDRQTLLKLLADLDQAQSLADAILAHPILRDGNVGRGILAKTERLRGELLSVQAKVEEKLELGADRSR